MDDNLTVAVEIQTSVVTREYKDMCNWLSDLASCPADCVNAILSALTFDPSHPHVTLAQQPFVSSGNGALMHRIEDARQVANRQRDDRQKPRDRIASAPPTMLEAAPRLYWFP